LPHGETVDEQRYADALERLLTRTEAVTLTTGASAGGGKPRQRQDASALTS
jgi:hypothetical protein